MSRFPKLTETFILFEIKALEEQGATVEIFPLWRERTSVMHEEAKKYVARAHFRRLLSGRLILANFKCLLTSPWKYFATLILGMCANWGSARYLLAFVATFPKAVLFADEMAYEGVQHVHAHFASHPAAVAFVIHRLKGIPYSFTAHGSDLHRDVHMLREKVEDAAFVVAISEFNRQKILAESGGSHADKVRVIHCGTDVSVFRPRAELDNNQSNGVLQIVCVGTLHEVKGQRHLIDACQCLHARGVPFHLHLVGSGPDAGQLKVQVDESGLRDHVTFHGSLTRPIVAQLLRTMQVAVAPSVPTSDGRREGIPVALMEAMSSGLPVIASQLTGIPELVTDQIHGRLVPPGDSMAIARALEEVAAQPQLREQWGQAARQTIERRFNLQRNAAELLVGIRQVASRPGSEQRCATECEVLR